MRLICGCGIGGVNSQALRPDENALSRAPQIKKDPNIHPVVKQKTLFFNYGY